MSTEGMDVFWARYFPRRFVHAGEHPKFVHVDQQAADAFWRAVGMLEDGGVGLPCPFCSHEGAWHVVGGAPKPGGLCSSCKTDEVECNFPYAAWVAEQLWGEEWVREQAEDVRDIDWRPTDLLPEDYYAGNPADEDVLCDYVLAPRGGAPQIGAERGRVVVNGVARFVSPHGSYRYVYFERGRALAGLQVVRRQEGHAVISCVYTLPEHRRRGLATRLLARARRDGPVEHAHPLLLSDAGRAWKEAVGNPSGQRENYPRNEDTSYDAAMRTVYVATLINPKDNRPVMVVASRRSVYIGDPTDDPKDFQPAGGGLLDGVTVAPGCPIVHTVAGVSVRGAGLGTMLYYGLALAAAHPGVVGALDFEDLEAKTPSLAEPCIASDIASRTRAAAAWWDAERARGRVAGSRETCRPEVFQLAAPAAVLAPYLTWPGGSVKELRFPDDELSGEVLGRACWPGGQDILTSAVVAASGLVLHLAPEVERAVGSAWKRPSRAALARLDLSDSRSAKLEAYLAEARRRR